jgi:hypothetical protein
VVSSSLTKSRAWQLGMATLIAAVGATAGPVTVTPSVTAIAGGFNYSYTVSETLTNSLGDDVFLIDIPVVADPSAVTNLMTPAGFESAFDSGLGLVSFLEDTTDFSSTPQSGFSFDSPFAPGSVTFSASVLSSTNGDIYTTSGLTTSPAPAPEPGYLGLFVCLVPAIFLYRRFRRACQPTQLKPAPRT